MSETGMGGGMRIEREAKLRLRSEYEVIPLEGGRVLLRSPDQGVRVHVDGVTADVLAGLIRALDGTRPLERVLASRPEGLLAGVDVLLRGLVDRDIIDVDGGCAAVSPEERFFSHFHDDPVDCSRRLHASRVTICGTGALADALERDLRGAGIVRITRAHRASEAHLGPACRAADLVMVASTDDGRGALEDMLSRLAIELGFTWLLARIFGREGFVGPLFMPGEGPCHACVQAREEANWVDPELTHAYLRRRRERPAAERAYGGLPAFVAITSQWAVVEATKYLARFDVPAIVGNVLRVDFVRCRTQLHRVLRLPRCRRCSPVARRPTVNALLYASGQ